MFEVLVKGFRTEAQARAFIAAYEGQGEQFASEWYSCQKQDGELDVTSMNTDLSEERWPPKLSGNTLEFWVKPR